MRPKKHVLVYSSNRNFLMLSHIAYVLRLGPYSVTTATTENEVLAAEDPHAVLMLCPDCTEEDEHMAWKAKNAFPDATVILAIYAHKPRPTAAILAADIVSFSFDVMEIRNKVRLGTQRKRGPKKRAA